MGLLDKVIDPLLQRGDLCPSVPSLGLELRTSP